ncbi:MAG: cytidine deaminase [Ruminococcaceae bacterium]|nr:cytidine deaminase [Oscillospiraceae bacterium]
MIDKELLLEKARQAMVHSYSPYSSFKVGAALLTKSGKVYTGTNIENSSFSATNCAERTAFFKAVSDGEKEFKAIAIVGGKNAEIKDACMPCGVCRQVMAEFCDKDFEIITASENEIIVKTLDELLPESFQLRKKRHRAHR